MQPINEDDLLIQLRAKLPGVEVSRNDATMLLQKIQATGGDEQKMRQVLAEFELVKKQQPQTVNVTGKREPIPTTVPSPFRGTTQEAANPDAPQASSMSAFDPRLAQQTVADARAAFEQAQRQNMRDRGIGQMIAGFSGSNIQAATQGWDERAKLERDLYDMKLKELEAQQTAATGGQNLATSMSAQARAEGTYMGTQREQQLKLDSMQMDKELKALSTEQQKQLYDPNSRATQLLRTMLMAQAYSLPTEGQRALLSALGNPALTAADLMPVAAQYSPAVQKAWLDRLSGKKSEQEIRGAAAEADIKGEGARQVTGRPSASAPAPAPAQPAGQSKFASTPDEKNKGKVLAEQMDQLERSLADAKPGSDTARRLQAYIDELKQEVRTHLNKQEQIDFTNARKAPAPAPEAPKFEMPSISVGGVTLQNPAAQGRITTAQADAQRRADLNNRDFAWRSVVAPTLKETLEMMESEPYTGPGGQVLANVMKSDGGQLEQKLLAIANQQGGVLPPSLAGYFTPDPKNPGRYVGVNLNTPLDQIRKALVDYANVAQQQFDMNRKEQNQPALGAEDRIDTSKYKIGPTRATAAPAKAGTVQMKRGNRVITIPENLVKEAEADGFKRL